MAEEHTIRDLALAAAVREVTSENYRDLLSIRAVDYARGELHAYCIVISRTIGGDPEQIKRELSDQAEQIVMTMNERGGEGIAESTEEQ